MKRFHYITLLLLTAVCMTYTNLPAMASCQRDCNEDSCLEIYGEYLFWEVVQDQIPYAARLPGGLQGLINAIETNMSLKESTSIIDVPFDWKSGFRVGIEYAPPCAEWDVQVVWTRLHEAIKGSTLTLDRSIIPLAEPTSIVLAFINRPSPNFSLATGANCDWRFHYDIVDVLWGNSYTCGECVHLRPSIGVKMADINQRLIVDYLGMAVQLNPQDPTLIPATVRVQKVNKFLAAGPSLYVGTAWKFARHWALSGGVGAALLYGKFTAYDRPLISVGPNAFEVTVKSNKQHRIRPTVNARFGIDWTGCICCQKVGIGVAYEWQYWWNQWQAQYSLPGTMLNSGGAPQGDLMLQGLTVRGSLLF